MVPTVCARESMPMISAMRSARAAASPHPKSMHARAPCAAQPWVAPPCATGQGWPEPPAGGGRAAPRCPPAPSPPRGCQRRQKHRTEYIPQVSRAPTNGPVFGSLTIRAAVTPSFVLVLAGPSESAGRHRVASQANGTLLGFFEGGADAACLRGSIHFGVARVRGLWRGAWAQRRTSRLGARQTVRASTGVP